MADKKLQPIIIKRVKKVAPAHHGGAWKIAYADFVTAMMAFFLLMWLLGSTAKGELQGIAAYFASPLKVAMTGGDGAGNSSSVIPGGGNDLTKVHGQVRRSDVEEAKQRRMSIDAARVELRPYSPDYLEQYRDIDIALDAMPYNGGLTTCEALYMGVPVVSIRGRSHGSRFGASILTNAGVRELLAENDINYVRRAVQLGNSPELIGAYHSGLRGNLLKSPLMDAANYMRELESAYRQTWQNFCTI